MQNSRLLKFSSTKNIINFISIKTKLRFDINFVIWI